MFSVLCFLLHSSLSLHVTDENFTNFLEDTSKHVMMNLGASWCQHCKVFASTWENLSSHGDYKDKVQFLDVDCEESREICKMFKGTTTPRIFWLSKDRKDVIQYMGGLGISHLENFIEKNLGEPFKEVDSARLKELIETSEERSLFVFSLTDNDKDFISTIKEIAKSNNETENIFVYKRAKGEKKLRVYSGKNWSSQFDGNWTKEEITRFVDLHMFPYCAELNGYILRNLERLRMTAFLFPFHGQEPSVYHILDTARVLEKHAPVLTVNCSGSGKWLCQFASIKNNETILRLDWFRRKFTRFNGNISDIDKVTHWANNIDSMRESGPGTGFIGQLKGPYYEHLARGGTGIPLNYLAAPFLIVGMVFMFTLDYYISRRTKKKSSKEE